MPGQDEELEFTFNHDGRGYEASLAEQGIEPEREPYRVREGGSLLCFVRDPGGSSLSAKLGSAGGALRRGAMGQAFRVPPVRVATLRWMLIVFGSLLLALFVAPAPWGVVLVGCAIVWEVAEKVFWFRYSKRIPVAVGREAMIGLPVTVVSACRPEGRVRLRGERWPARCAAGAGVGDRLVVEGVEQITLVVGKPGSAHAQDV